MHDLLLNQLTTKRAQLNPHVLDIVLRTRQLGLHKVAAHTNNCAEYGLAEVIRDLGTKLAYAHLKQQKIASGLGSLRELQLANIIKLSNQQTLQAIRNLPSLGRQMGPMGRAMPPRPALPPTGTPPAQVQRELGSARSVMNQPSLATVQNQLNAARTIR